MAEDLRRLFEQGGDETPVLTRRVAWGLAGTATKNSTWQTIVTWLQGVLNFLRPANNLSDVTNPATALSNLGGIGSAALTPYALKANVLELNNTVEFTPDNNYEPATKKYVDDQNPYSVVEQFSVTGDHSGGNFLWSRHGRTVSVSGQFVTDGFDAPYDGTVMAASPFGAPASTTIPVVATAFATQERVCGVGINPLGLLYFSGNTEPGPGSVYRFSLTYILGE